MNKDMWWWSAIIVTVFFLITIAVISGNYEVKKLEKCKDGRIRNFPAEYFTWQGVQDLGAKGLYQPKCL